MYCWRLRVASCTKKQSMATRDEIIITADASCRGMNPAERECRAQNQHEMKNVMASEGRRVACCSSCCVFESRCDERNGIVRCTPQPLSVQHACAMPGQQKSRGAHRAASNRISVAMGRGVQLRGLLAFIGVRISQAALNDLEELYDVGRNTSDFPNSYF